jgi:hypothetical protein
MLSLPLHGQPTSLRSLRSAAVARTHNDSPSHARSLPDFPAAARALITQHTLARHAGGWEGRRAAGSGTAGGGAKGAALEDVKNILTEAPLAGATEPLASSGLDTPVPGAYPGASGARYAPLRRDSRADAGIAGARFQRGDLGDRWLADSTSSCAWSGSGPLCQARVRRSARRFYCV